MILLRKCSIGLRKCSRKRKWCDMNKSEIQIRKFLSSVLRHKPDKIDIQIDSNGWVDVDVLLVKSNLSFFGRITVFG